MNARNTPTDDHDGIRFLAQFIGWVGYLGSIAYLTIRMLIETTGGR